MVQACRVKNKDTRPILFILTCVLLVNTCYLWFGILAKYAVTTKFFIRVASGLPVNQGEGLMIASIVIGTLFASII